MEQFDARYFDELLERVKVIRTSERMSYQKITDIFIATSVDYDKNSEEALKIKEKFDKNTKSYPYLGDVLSEKELINIIDNIKC